MVLRAVGESSSIMSLSEIGLKFQRKNVIKTMKWLKKEEQEEDTLSKKENLDEDSLPAALTQTDNSDRARGPIWQALDYIENIIVRMIAGIFTFIFLRIPRWIMNLIYEWMPTFGKFLKVCVLLLAWFSIILSIPLLMWFTDIFNIGEPIQFRSFSDANFNWAISEIAKSPISYFWILLCVAGSVWGILYYRRKRKLRKVALEASTSTGQNTETAKQIQ